MNLVQHLAIIMDGNGRWAERRGLPRWKGHEEGALAVRRISEAACRRGIRVLTLFAFSSENWKRPPEEIRLLFSLLHRYLSAEVQHLVRNEIRVSAVGRRDRIPRSVSEGLAAAEQATRGCSRLHLRIALDYGSRYEIVEAARRLAEEVEQCRLRPADITEELFTRQLPPEPDPDLVVRTAGEQRLSNFLLWQAAYSELYFCPKFWPDFDEDDLDQALAAFTVRTRKFGALVRPTGTGG